MHVHPVCRDAKYCVSASSNVFKSPNAPVHHCTDAKHCASTFPTIVKSFTDAYMETQNIASLRRTPNPFPVITNISQIGAATICDNAS